LPTVNYAAVARSTQVSFSASGAGDLDLKFTAT